MQTVAFCEIDPFCRKVLAKHWPKVPRHNDVRTLSRTDIERNSSLPEVICGGFPCQDISAAGRGIGIAGERSALWAEYARLIGDIRPRYVIVENVAALLVRGLGVVLGDLAALGYDAEWHCIPASYVGAPHERDRIWIVAYPSSIGRQQDTRSSHGNERTNAWFTPENNHLSQRNGQSNRKRLMADTNGQRELQSQGTEPAQRRWLSHSGEDMAYSNIPRLEKRRGIGDNSQQELPPIERSRQMADADSSDGFWRIGAVQMGWGRFAKEIAGDGNTGRTQWGVEPSIRRVVDGVPNRVHRLKALGNSIVPQVAEMIGLAIMRQEFS